MPTEIVALTRMAEISSPKLRGAIGVSPSLPRIPDHAFRVRISDMDNPEPEHAGEEYDYESLPETSSFTTFMIAGAIAGIMEHCVMYPIDCVKVKPCLIEKIAIYCGSSSESSPFSLDSYHC